MASVTIENLKQDAIKCGPDFVSWAERAEMLINCRFAHGRFQFHKHTIGRIEKISEAFAAKELLSHDDWIIPHRMVEQN